jgi:uncharacterized membrane protein
MNRRVENVLSFLIGSVLFLLALAFYPIILIWDYWNGEQ